MSTVIRAKFARKIRMYCCTCLALNSSYALALEVDPIAYALNGYSLHVGFGERNFRFDMGIFGLEVPSSFHGNDNYNLAFKSYGIKLDYPFASYQGLLVGLEASTSDAKYGLKSSEETTSRTEVSLGPRIGYRYLINENITPWLGVGFNLSFDDVTLSGETFNQGIITFFPTILIGWKF